MDGADRRRHLTLPGGLPTRMVRSGGTPLYTGRRPCRRSRSKASSRRRSRSGSCRGRDDRGVSVVHVLEREHRAEHRPVVDALPLRSGWGALSVRRCGSGPDARPTAGARRPGRGGAGRRRGAVDPGPRPSRDRIVVERPVTLTPRGTVAGQSGQSSGVSRGLEGHSLAQGGTARGCRNPALLAGFGSTRRRGRDLNPRSA